MKELDLFRRPPERSLPDRVIAKVRKRLGGFKQRFRLTPPAQAPITDYIARTNAELLKREVIREPLTEIEIWSVTDIHDHAAGGVSIEEMAAALPGCELVGWHTFAFYGPLRSQLPAEYQKREDELASEGDKNGSKISSIWRRTE
jgi:hypothetical protein